MWSIKTKQKLKQQISSRLTEPKNGLTVAKGKGTGKDEWEGKDKGEKRGIMISTHNVGGLGRNGEGSIAQRREAVTL